jgi:hypothetical protein
MLGIYVTTPIQFLNIKLLFQQFVLSQIRKTVLDFKIVIIASLSGLEMAG